MDFTERTQNGQGTARTKRVNLHKDFTSQRPPSENMSVAEPSFHDSVNVGLSVSLWQRVSWLFACYVTHCSPCLVRPDHVVATFRWLPFVLAPSWTQSDTARKLVQNRVDRSCRREDQTVSNAVEMETTLQVKSSRFFPYVTPHCVTSFCPVLCAFSRQGLENERCHTLLPRCLQSCVNTTPQMTRFRGAKVCSKWLQEGIDDRNIQSDYKCTNGLKV